MLKYEFKDAPVERKQELLSEIIDKYNVANRNELIQALGHAQAVLDCNQEEFAKHPSVSISSRQLRSHKKEYLDLYTSAYDKYSNTAPELVDVKTEVDEDVLEQTYQNLLARLKSPKTKTADIATILEYFGITKRDFKQYADFRNKTMRGFMSDNLTQIITDGDKAQMVKTIVAESPYLYQGTEKTLGRTANSLNIDMSSNLARLEAQTLGLLFMGLINGRLSEQFINNAETLRLLKLASGDISAKDTPAIEFEKMDGRQPKSKEIKEADLIELFGEVEGKEVYRQLNKVKDKVAKNTALKLPNYEDDVKPDYEAHLKDYPEVKEMPFRILIAKLDARYDREFNDRYKQFLNVNED
ncbi:MAG: hypothetical protein ACK4M9_11985 [Anaerobacillus sp.]|uniref:hypothetical protein n=1 Tax=Anaerobacillus sp. TaxID=1872506 RepID=UPI00391B73F7